MQLAILLANHLPVKITSGIACTTYGIDSFSPTIMNTIIISLYILPSSSASTILNDTVLLSEGTFHLPSKHNPLTSFHVLGGFLTLSPNWHFVEFCLIERLMVTQTYQVIACTLEMTCIEDVRCNVSLLPNKGVIL